MSQSRDVGAQSGYGNVVKCFISENGSRQANSLLLVHQGGVEAANRNPEVRLCGFGRQARGRVS